MTKALIVEDDPRIQGSVQDMVESLGHESTGAASQEESRELIETEKFDYVLLDLEIPVKLGRNAPRLQNGINLLSELVDRYGKQVPVIITTGHGTNGPDICRECMKAGATDYVVKPLPSTGRTLEKVILEALGEVGHGNNQRRSRKKRPNGPPQQFAGGTLRLFSRRVEIHGVEIPISPLMHDILEALSERRPSGQYIAYAGADLINLLDADCGQNGIASQVLEFRKRVEERLLSEANVSIERKDIIVSGGPGYRFKDWITLEMGKRPRTLEVEKLSENSVASGAGDEKLAMSDSFSHYNERQQWILRQLKREVQLQARHVVDHFGCSSTTAKRDLVALKSEGVIRFCGSARAGFYQLTSLGMKRA